MEQEIIKYLMHGVGVMMWWVVLYAHFPKENIYKQLWWVLGSSVYIVVASSLVSIANNLCTL